MMLGTPHIDKCIDVNSKSYHVANENVLEFPNSKNENTTKQTINVIR